MWKDVSLRLIVKDKGGKQHCLPFCWFFSLCTLHWGFKKIPFALCTYVLAKILKNGAKFIQKLTPGFKISGKSKKLKFDGLFLSKKYIPSGKTYTNDLSNITFNYLCDNSPNFFCHFWNHKSLFTTQLFCIFLAQTLHTNKVHIFRISTARVKIHQIPYFIFQTKNQFFSKFESLFSVLRDNSALF